MIDISSLLIILLGTLFIVVLTVGLIYLASHDFRGEQMTETRIKVDESAVRIRYTPQYKVKFLCFSWWEDFDHDCTGIAFEAYLQAAKRYDRETKEYAEHVCERYTMMKVLTEEDSNKQKLHKKTSKVSYYKHP